MERSYKPQKGQHPVVSRVPSFGNAHTSIRTFKNHLFPACLAELRLQGLVFASFSSDDVSRVSSPTQRELVSSNHGVFIGEFN